MQFDEFARSRLPALVRFTAAMCADRALAEDVVQEVMLRLHPRWAEIERLDAPEAYVRRCLVNEYLSWRRKWARLVPQADLPEHGAAVPDHATALTERAALTDELAALPARQRTVLVMRYYGQLSDAEIADVLGCRPATVRGYVARALASLRVTLNEELDVPTGSSHAH